MSEPPAIKLVDGDVQGFLEFSHWAMENDKLWYSVVNYSGRAGCPQPVALKFIACEQTVQVRRLTAILNRYVAECGPDILNAASK